VGVDDGEEFLEGGVVFELLEFGFFGFEAYNLQF
jgi:hypothetical protein